MSSNFDDSKEMKELQKDHDELDKLARELVDKINNTNKRKKS